MLLLLLPLLLLVVALPLLLLLPSCAQFERFFETGQRTRLSVSGGRGRRRRRYAGAEVVAES